MCIAFPLGSDSCLRYITLSTKWNYHLGKLPTTTDATGNEKREHYAKSHDMATFHYTHIQTDIAKFAQETFAVLMSSALFFPLLSEGTTLSVQQAFQ